jgi:hypothetical protein
VVVAEAAVDLAEAVSAVVALVAEVSVALVAEAEVAEVPVGVGKIISLSLIICLKNDDEESKFCFHNFFRCKTVSC